MIYILIFQFLIKIKNLYEFTRQGQKIPRQI